MRTRQTAWPASGLLVLMAACAGNGAPIAPSSPPFPRAELAPFIGWFTLEPERHVLITWGARADLRMFSFGDRPLAADLLRSVGDSFRWRVANETSRSVEFRRGADGDVTGFEWIDELGQTRVARALTPAPYEARELSFAHAGATLSGTLFEPRTGPPRAGVAIIHGSGTSDRDNYWYMSIAHALAMRGVAVLLPDKRGSGRSQGDWRTASFDTLAGDAAAGLGAMAQTGELARTPIGVMGLSQGGRLAPLVPAHDRRVAFVVNVSGAAVTLEEQLEHETRMTLRQSRWPGFLHGLIRPIAVRRARGRDPQWWALNGSVDPIPAWRNLEVPGLIVYGAEDEYDNVPVARSVERLKHADAAGAPAGLTIIVYEGSGHALYAPGTTRVREDFLQQLVDWVARQARQQGQSPAAAGCRCVDGFNRMVHLVTASYAGFDDKVTDRAALARLTTALRSKAAAADARE